MIAARVVIRRRYPGRLSCCATQAEEGSGLACATHALAELPRRFQAERNRSDTG
jgi:hypothetical protein